MKVGIFYDFFVFTPCFCDTNYFESKINLIYIKPLAENPSNLENLHWLVWSILKIYYKQILCMQYICILLNFHKRYTSSNSLLKIPSAFLHCSKNSLNVSKMIACSTFECCKDDRVYNNFRTFPFCAVIPKTGIRTK